MKFWLDVIVDQRWVTKFWKVRVGIDNWH